MTNTTLNLTWLSEKATSNGQSIRHCYRVTGSTSALESLELWITNYDDDKFVCPFVPASDGNGYVYFINKKAATATLELRTTADGTEYYHFVATADPLASVLERVASLKAQFPDMPYEMLLKMVLGA